MSSCVELFQKDCCPPTRRCRSLDCLCLKSRCQIPGLQEGCDDKLLVRSSHRPGCGLLGSCPNPAAVFRIMQDTEAPGFPRNNCEAYAPESAGLHEKVDAVKFASRRCLDRDGTSRTCPLSTPCP